MKKPHQAGTQIKCDDPDCSEKTWFGIGETEAVLRAEEIGWDCGETDKCPNCKD